MRFLIKGIALLGLCIFVNMAVQAEPLLFSDFEGLGQDGLPKAWAFTWQTEPEAPRPGGGSWYVDPHEGHSGKHSLRGAVETDLDFGVWHREPVAIPEDAKFIRLTAWVKAEDVRSSAGAVAVAFVDRDGQPTGNSGAPIIVGADCDWTRFVTYVAVPEEAVSATIRCWMGHAFTKCGTFWWDDISLEVVPEAVEMVTRYIDETPMPELTATEQERGYILFSRDYTRVLFPNAVPEPHERVRRLALSACAGEYEPVVLGIRALRDTEGLSVRCSALKGAAGKIPAGAVEVRQVATMSRMGQARWGLFNETMMHDVPLYLKEHSTADLMKDRSGAFWITVHVPEDVAPGEYTGIVAIEQADGPTAEIPISVTIHPFELAEPEGTFFGMYTRAQRSPEWIRDAIADQRAHGMTGLACYGGIPTLTLQDGKVRIAWTGETAFELWMDGIVQAGFTEPVLWLMGHSTIKVPQQAGPLDSEAFEKAYRSLIEAVVHKAKERGWPEIIFQPIDEPFEWEKRMATNKRLLEILKSVPGVRTEGDGMNGKWENFTDDVYELTDVINLHDGPMLDRHAPIDMPAYWEFQQRAKADGKEIWFYNIDLTAWHPESMRFMSGFGLWKSKASGIIEWCYMVPVNERTPDAVYNPTALLYRFPTTRTRGGGPTIGYEAKREGIDDYRYLVTFDQMARKAEQSGMWRARRYARKARKRLAKALEKVKFDGCTGVAMQGDWTGQCEVLPDGTRNVRGDHKVPNGLEFDDYKALRAMLAEATTKLQDLLTEEAR